MHEQSPFDFSLAGSLRHRQKIKVIGIFKDLLCQVRTGRRQSTLEVGQRLPFSLVKPTLDLEDEDILAPSMFHGGFQVPLPRRPVLNPVEEPRLVAPGQLCNNLLHKFLPVKPRRRPAYI